MISKNSDSSIKTRVYMSMRPALTGKYREMRWQPANSHMALEIMACSSAVRENANKTNPKDEESYNQITFK